MASSIPFNFRSIRQLQKLSTDGPETKPYSTFDDPRLHEASSLLCSDEEKKALIFIDDVIKRAGSEEPRVLHQALLLRADVYSSMGSFPRATSDLELAITLRPAYVDAYRKLSAAELERKQFGRAEVALLLGLRVDPANAGLKRRLTAIRDVDPLVGDVKGLDRSDRTVRDRQRRAGSDLFPPNIPELVMCVMTGDLPRLKKLWEPESRDLRHGDIGNPLMHFPVLGAQRLSPVGADQREKEKILEEYKATIDFLFDQGVRLDARDCVGYTAVMHAAGHLPQPELLQHLLSKGADPNLKSVYGTVALMDATMNQNVTEIDLLMKNEADPNVADNDGMTPLAVGQDFKECIAVYHRHMLPEMPARLCEKCTEKGTKRCTKCRVAYYCGRDCQLGDWPAHKSRCKKLCKSHKRVALAADDMYYTMLPDVRSQIMKNFMNQELPNLEPETVEVTTGKLFDAYNDEWNKNGNMLLKIQAVMKSPGCPDMDGALLVYNQKRNFQCKLDPKKLDGQELLSIIREKGVGRGKAYFWAYMEKGKPELIVITDPMHPAQPW